MTAPPLVSVLMTAFNREAYIAEAIESVLGQTLHDLELIVSDDRSTDRTAAIAQEYACRDSRVRVYVNPHNLGDYANRNQTATLARGTFLKFHDSDDVMYPHCLAVMVDALQRTPSAGFALSANLTWPGAPCPIPITPRLAFEREYLGSGLFQMGPAAAMFRTDAFRALGGFPDEGVASDFLFWLRSCAKVDIVLVPGDLFYYRVHDGQELTNPRNAQQYARARGAAWAMLNSAGCPLDPADLDRAKSNFLWAGARDAWRHAARRDWRGAADVVRFMGAGPSDWMRHFRRPRRSPTAGTPPA